LLNFKVSALFYLGALLDDGSQQQASGSPWGKIQIDLDSCDQGTVKYQSDCEDFGSGQFRIQRLATVKQLGCSDNSN
jgi:hypothetical protein